MKKFLAILMTIIMLVSMTAFSAEEEAAFVRVSVPCPEAEELFATDYQTYSHLMARYADDKAPIPLSSYYDGMVYATIPAENAHRPIEWFAAQELEFTDDTNNEFEFYIMGQLSATGIIKGDDMGRALPFANVTRAEATAMVMRLIGVDATDDTNSGFGDVDEKEWYAGVITAARERGIVAGDTDAVFSPHRNVSREEIVVMVARALWHTGIAAENKGVTAEAVAEKIRCADAESLADWALPAYYTIGSYTPCDYVETDRLDAEGIPITDYYLNPKKSATRFEIADVINRALENLQIYPSQMAVEFGFDKIMPVIDGSTSTLPFTHAVYSSLFEGGYFHPQRPEKHSKSHQSYERLINGEIDMMFASVYPAQDILKLAEEKGVELELIPIAYDAMIFFTNADNPATDLTKEQISDIYVNNAYESWSELGGPDALLYPYCRNNDSGSHAQMERHFLNGNEINEQIRNETTSVTMANVLTDVMSAQTDEPVGYGLGYSIYYYFHNMDMFYGTSTELKLLAIDGVFPTDETIANGTYPLSNNTYVVIRKDQPADSPARKMAQFMLTEQGQECVEAAGFGRLK